MNKLPLHLYYLTDNCLSSVSFSQHDIAQIIQNLYPNKPHDHDNINICMLKICGSSIYKPLKMIFKQCIIKTSFFLSEWEKSKIVLIHNRLSSVSFSQHYIAQIIQNLVPNKPHDNDNISICMLKICGSSIYKPQKIVFKQCIKTSVFLSEREKGNIVLIHKKEDKQTLKNTVQCCCYEVVAKFFKDYCLTKCSNFSAQMLQSSKPGDSCINQFLSITHEIHESFDVAWWYHLQINSKWNVGGELTKPFVGKITMLGYLGVPSLILYCF